MEILKTARREGFALGSAYRRNPWALAFTMGIVVRKSTTLPTYITFVTVPVEGRVLLVVPRSMPALEIDLCVAGCCGMLHMRPEGFRNDTAGWIRFERHPLGRVFARAFLGVDDMRLAG